MRLALALATLLIGVALAIVGFFLAAPLGAPSGPAISEPLMPFAPGVFVIGVTLFFGAAIVYELFPERVREA